MKGNAAQQEKFWVGLQKFCVSTFSMIQEKITFVKVNKYINTYYMYVSMCISVLAMKYSMVSENMIPKILYI